MLFPEYYVVLLYLFESSFSQFYGRRQTVRHDTYAERSESQCLRNHRPKHTCHLIAFEEALDVWHSHQFDRVGMESSLIAWASLKEIVLQCEVSRELWGRHYRFVSNDFVACAVVANAHDRAILHRPASEIAHSLASSFAVEILTLELWKHHTDLLYRCNGRHSFAFLVHKLGDIDGDITAITLSPSLLPEVTSHLCNLIDYGFKAWASF